MNPLTDVFLVLDVQVLVADKYQEIQISRVVLTRNYFQDKFNSRSHLALEEGKPRQTQYPSNSTMENLWNECIRFETTRCFI